jgi:hypothetical protein
VWPKLWRAPHPLLARWQLAKCPACTAGPYPHLGSRLLQSLPIAPLPNPAAPPPSLVRSSNGRVVIEAASPLPGLLGSLVDYDDDEDDSLIPAAAAAKGASAGTRPP